MNRKKILVTGGTGVLGAAVCQSFAQSGNLVTATYWQEAELETFHMRFGDSSNVLDPIQADLSRADDARSAVQEAAQRMSGLDVVCNIAGGFAMAPIEKVTESQLEQMLSMNLRSAFWVSQASVPHLRKSQNGKLIYIGSRAVFQGGAGLTAYTLAKAGVHSLVQSLAEELKVDNIQVNGIVPSIIDTPGNRKSMPEADHGKWVSPEALAGIVAFLCSPTATPISGAILPVYGQS